MTTTKKGVQRTRVQHTTKNHTDAEERMGAAPPMADAPQGSPPVAPAAMRAPAVKRRRLLGSLVTTLAALLAASCGGGDGSSPYTSAASGGSGGSGAGSGSGAGTTGAVTLSVDAVASPSSIAGLQPAAEAYFLTVQATLRDVSAPEAIPVGFAHYTLATAKGLVITPSVASAVVSMPCASDTSLSTGAQYTCTISFDVPRGDSPTRLSYDDQHGDSATVPVAYTLPLPPVSAACETFATYQRTFTDACVQCLITQCASQANTFTAKQHDGNTCPSAGTACATCPMFPSSSGYCGCYDACLGGCQPAFDALSQCYVDRCSAACM